MSKVKPVWNPHVRAWGVYSYDGECIAVRLYKGTATEIANRSGNNVK